MSTAVDKKEPKAQWQAEVDVHEFTLKEVAQHKTKADCWIVIHDKVYDVTKYSHDHPGGADSIWEVAGQDATSVFEDLGHSEDAREIMHAYLVGVVKGASAKTPAQTVRVIRRDADDGEHHRHLSQLHNAALLAAGLGVIGLAALIPATLRRTGIHFDFLSHYIGGGGSGNGFVRGFFAATALSGVVMFALARRVMKAFNPVEDMDGIAKYPPRIPARRSAPKHTPAGFLKPRDYQTLPLTQREDLSDDTVRYTFALPKAQSVVGLPIGQHVAIRAHLDDGTVVTRSYTPTSNNADLGRLVLVVKNYADGLLTGKYLSKLRVGDEVEFRGPKGAMRYRRGYAKKIGMVAGGTGITPLYQIIRAVCEDDFDTTEISLVYANRSEKDILLRKELDRFAKAYPKNLKIHYVLDTPPAGWTGGSGRANKQTFSDNLPAPAEDAKFLVCGPPGMVNAVKSSLVDLGCKPAGAVSKMSDDIFCF